MIFALSFCDIAFATGRLSIDIQDIPDSETDNLIVVLDGGVEARIELAYRGGGALSHTFD